MKTGYIMLILFLGYSVFGQENQTIEGVLEGSRIVVDLIGVLKSNDTKTRNATYDCKKMKAADVCFVNKKEIKLEVELSMRDENQSPYVLIISKNHKECAVLIPAGIYNYKVVDSASKEVLRRGDVVIKICSHLSIGIE